MKYNKTGVIIRFNKSLNIARNADVSDTTDDEKRMGRWLHKTVFCIFFQTDTLHHSLLEQSSHAGSADIYCSAVTRFSAFVFEVNFKIIDEPFGEADIP